jgi:RNA polymerase sigma factor (sigma-70 family)
MKTEERQAFEVVFRSSYASVLRTVFVILHDRDRAEEVTQDAFLRLFEKWGGLRRVEYPAAYARTCAVRAAIRQGRRNKVVVVVSEVHATAAPDQLPDVDLARAVASLPVRQRAAVALFYLDDRPVEEVAELLGVSGSTVKQHLHRARATLAGVLAERPEEVANDVDR